MIRINVPPQIRIDTENMEVRVMIRIVTALAVLALLIVVPAGQATAQDNTLGGALIGGGIGAIIGGAATRSPAVLSVQRRALRSVRNSIRGAADITGIVDIAICAGATAPTTG